MKLPEKDRYYGEIAFPYYRIINMDTGQEVYWAGNNPRDSKQTTSKESGLDLDTMIQYCNQTGKELAEDDDAIWLGLNEKDDIDW